MLETFLLVKIYRQMLTSIIWCLLRFANVSPTLIKSCVKKKKKPNGWQEKIGQNYPLKEAP